MDTIPGQTLGPVPRGGMRPAAAPDLRGRGTPPPDTSSLSPPPASGKHSARTRARNARPVPREAGEAAMDLAGRSRTCGLRLPKPAGWPSPLRPVVDRAPPAGFEPAASGLRARRLQPCSTTGACIELRRQDSNLPLAGNGRASCRIDHAGLRLTVFCRRRARHARARPDQLPPRVRDAQTHERKAKREDTRAERACPARSGRSGRRGTRTPKAGRPTRFRDGIPRRWQSFRSGPGRRRTCTAPGKSRALCRVELRSRDVAGRSRTCCAPRFRRALYRLSYGHVVLFARAAPDMRGRGWWSPASEPARAGHRRLAARASGKRSAKHARAARLLARSGRSGMGGAGVEPALPPYQRGALPLELSAVEVGEAGFEPAASCL